MKARAKAGETVQSDPRKQLLTDLYARLEPLLLKGHGFVIGGDFNIRLDEVWGPSSDTFAGLGAWSAALEVRHAGRELHEQPIPTRSRSPSTREGETEPDHVFVSGSLFDQGAVKGYGVFVGGAVNFSDHKPMVLELDMAAALGLGVDGHPLGSDSQGRPGRPQQAPKLMADDVEACWDLQDYIAAAPARSELENATTAIEATAATLVAKGCLEAASWETYGRGQAVDLLREQLDDTLLQAMALLVEAQDAAVGPAGPRSAARGGTTKHGWSAEYERLKTLKKEMERAGAVVDSKAKRNRVHDVVGQLQVKCAQLGWAGAIHPLPEMFTGRDRKAWVDRQKKVLASLLRDMHGAKRREMREASSGRQRQVRDKAKLNKWKGLFRAALKKDWASGNKEVVMVRADSEAGKG
jgi:hypothetical protein